MHRVDVPSATVDNQFTEGSPAGGIPATIVPADWLNDLQENVCQSIELSGITLVKGDASQLFDAIVATQSVSFLASLGAGGTSATDYIKLPFRDKTTGVLRYLTINVGLANAGGGTSSSVTLPSAYALRHFAAFAIDAGASGRTVGLSANTLTSATFLFSGPTNSFYFLSFGV